MSSTAPSAPVMADTLYSKFAQERSHNDAKGLVEYGKALIQTIIGINGLAATGLITLAAATKENAITIAGHFVPAIICYLVGVFFGILSFVFVYGSTQYWAMRWEQSAYPNMTLSIRYRKKGIFFHSGAIIVSIFGLLAFLAGGSFAVEALRNM